MSKYKRIAIPVLDRCTIARECEDGPVAADGYLGTLAADPAYARTDVSCYRANATETEFKYDNKHCAPRWIGLSVCLKEPVPDGDEYVFEVHGSNDDFATMVVLASLSMTAGDEDYAIFNMEKACVGYKCAKIQAVGAVGAEMGVYLSPVNVMGT